MVYLASCAIVGYVGILLLPLILLGLFAIFAVFVIELDKALKPFVTLWNTVKQAVKGN